MSLAAIFICAQVFAIDGDTMICKGGQRVRLWGIQAPETSDPTGPAATRALAAIVGGRTVICLRKGQSYNRTVAQCYRWTGDVAGEMVRRGHAVDWPRYSRGHYAR